MNHMDKCELLCRQHGEVSPEESICLQCATDSFNASEIDGMEMNPMETSEFPGGNTTPPEIREQWCKEWQEMGLWALEEPPFGEEILTTIPADYRSRQLDGGWEVDE